MGELRAIRGLLERRSAGSDVTAANAFAVLTGEIEDDTMAPAAVAEAFEAEARAVKSAAPGAQRKRGERGRK